MLACKGIFATTAGFNTPTLASEPCSPKARGGEGWRLAIRIFEENSIAVVPTVGALRHETRHYFWDS